jgi:Chalcone isomerase-like
MRTIAAVARRLLVSALILPSTCFAVQLGGTTLPDSWTLDGETLVLNGAGLREYSFLRVPIYAAALYFEKRETKARVLLEAHSPIVIHLKMLRDVSRADSVKGWQVYLIANCKLPCQLDSEALASFNRMIPESKKQDEQTYVFSGGNVDVYLNTVKLGTVSNKLLARTILNAWLGDEPTTESLKRALLGTSSTQFSN